MSFPPKPAAGNESGPINGRFKYTTTCISIQVVVYLTW